MTGRELVAALLADGFTVQRRSRSLVWLARGEQRLLIDEDAEQPDTILEKLLDPPKSGGTRL